MLRLLIRKYAAESLLLWLACAVMLFSFCWVRVWIVCQFDLQQFEPFLEQFRTFERFSPVPLEQLLTYAGSIGMTFDEPVLILCVVVWSISRGSDVVSGELGRGTMEMVLAQPLRRSTLLTAHAIVVVVGLAVLCLVAWLGLCAGILTNSVKQTLTPTLELRLPLLPIEVPIQTGPSQEVMAPLAERLDPAVFLPATLNLFSFGFFLYCLSVACSCFDRYRWRTIGIVIGTYVVQFLIFLLSRAAPATRFFEHLTFFSYYQPDAMVQLVKNHPQTNWTLFQNTTWFGGVSSPAAYWPFMLGPAGMSMALIAIGVLLFGLGAWRFNSRDLPAPL